MNVKHNNQWRMMLLGETGKLDERGRPIRSEFNYCRVISELLIGDIAHGHVLDVLKPIWNEKRETATGVRGRIERVLGWGVAQGWRDTSTRTRTSIQRVRTGRCSKRFRLSFSVTTPEILASLQTIAPRAHIADGAVRDTILEREIQVGREKESTKSAAWLGL
jgi:hypothetical protein